MTAGADAHTGEPRFEVVWPLGKTGGTPIEGNPRPAELHGKRIAFVWDHVFKGDEMFDIFSQVARERFENVSFVPHDQFGNVHGSVAEEHDAVAALPDRLDALEVDAVVVGVGA